jgi:hypothetical protein
MLATSRDVRIAASFCLYRTRQQLNTRSDNLTVEAATFGSDFVELRICKEPSVALRYKLRARIPESTLTMKHNAIHYLSTREAAAARILRVDETSETRNTTNPKRL